MPEAGGGRGLGAMTRRKSEITGLMNERDFPHLVEFALPPGGFRTTTADFDAFRRGRGFPIRRGRGRQEGVRKQIVEPVFGIRSMSGSASLTLPQPTHSTIGSVVSA